MEETADRRYLYKIVSSSTLHKDSIKYLKQIRDLYGPYLHQEKSIKTKAQNSVESFFPSELSNFEKTISSCKLCELGNSRNKFVFGVGDPFADILLVGEAPGKEEDLKGEPFVGKAGKLLDKILSAIQMNRNKNVYICNVLKCRPPMNRDPLPIEAEKCEPYLLHQIKLIKPKIIVALGRISATTLLQLDVSLKSLRGKLHDYYGTPLLVTYHPAALLRNQNLKKFAWDDFQFIRDFVKEKN